MTMQVEAATPLWIAARVLLYERGDDFFRLRDRVLETFDPEDIHDLRVASRRLREGLALFAPCYLTVDITFLVKKLKKVTRLLGEIRNTDEAIMFFALLADELGESCRSSLVQQVLLFRNTRKKELQRLKTGLPQNVPKSLLDQFRGVINSPPLFSPSVNSVDLLAPLSGFAGESLDNRLADALKLVPDAVRAEQIEAQHMLRIAVKHFRYRMEILSFLIGTNYEELHAAVKDYQDVLGKMHDLDIFAGAVREAVFPAEMEKSVLDAIATKRAKLFTEFSAMLATRPLERIGAQVRSILQNKPG
jgi:CHAD domain-containing protein